jgi:hypothetical protein
MSRSLINPINAGIQNAIDASCSSSVGGTVTHVFFDVYLALRGEISAVVAEVLEDRLEKKQPGWGRRSW